MRKEQLEYGISRYGTPLYIFDLDMLTEAGYAVAMGNAATCVKAQADFVTGDCESDGIARALTWLMERNM